METLEWATDLPFPRPDVFAWFARPGALTRLTPPFAGRVLSEPSDGLRPGSAAELAVVPPGTLGLAAVSAAELLPVHLRPETRWRAVHTALAEGVSFVDEMASGPLRSWRHTHGFDVRPGGTVMRDRIEYELPRALDHAAGRRWVRTGLERMLAYRGRQAAADLDFHARHTSRPLTVAVTGASGLIGRQVCALLEGGGHQVLRLVRRRPAAPGEVSWDPGAGVLDPAALARCDAVVHLAGHPIGGRFTAANKRRILASRVAGTGLIARALAALAADGVPRALVSASAIGRYGAHPPGAGVGPDARPLSEDAPPGDDFLAGVCTAWERACDPARAAGVRVVTVRTGLVLTPAGGLLARFLPLYLAGVGGPLGRDEWQSWIGIDDVAQVYARAVVDDAFVGPVNAVAPNPVTAAEFARTLGRVLRRPAAIPVPRFGPRLLLGSEGAAELAGADQRVAPAALLRYGYAFRHVDLEQQLRHVLGRA